VFGHAEDIDAAVLSDDRLADPNFAIHLERAWREPTRNVRGDEVRVIGASRPEDGTGQFLLIIHQVRGAIVSSKSGCSGLSDVTSGGTRPSPNSCRRCAAIRTASGFKSLPRNRRPRRRAAIPTLPDPMNGSHTTSPVFELWRMSTSATSAGFSAGYPPRIRGTVMMS